MNYDLEPDEKSSGFLISKTGFACRDTRGYLRLLRGR